ncbi:MAG: endo-1,4-beta-xylanase [Methylacidiphilales bacterium]|nr:endo-1,4-beta-xylanase [Candidatus Methylacidiphilales bacterium]
MKTKTSLGTIAAAILILIAPVSRAADNPNQVPGAPTSPWGFGGGDWNLEADIQMEAIGCHENRTTFTNWERVEPEPGKWNFEQMDANLKYLEEHKIRTGGWFFGSGWVNGKRTGGFPVRDLSGWSKYVTEVVKHANGRIKSWEVWNEPPNGGVNRKTAVQDYPKIMQAAYNAAHAADPTCLVGIAAASNNVNFLDRVIKGGANGYFDYITVHPYELLGTVLDNNGSEAVFMSIVPTLRKMLAERDPNRINCPIVFTELGCDFKRQGGAIQGQGLVKAYTLGIAQGVTCIHWFMARDAKGGSIDSGMGIIAGDGTPRPAFIGLGNMIKYLGQNPTYLGLVLFHEREYGFVFQGAEGPVLLTWAPKGDPAHVDFGQEVRIIDPLTGQETKASTYDLTVAPVIVLDVPEKLVAEAKAAKGKPFPWGGDYTDAKSVSITMGEHNIEKGLHTKAGDAIAKDVIAYGNGARPGDIGDSVTFMVDPNFLSYTTVPIEISAVVRRDPNNSPAEIKLTYESTSEFKTLPPEDVPDNKNWHTLKWRIDDAQFVSIWGFSFRFNNGPYYVQSVTVTKL